MPANRAVHIVAHETYPGHHTENAWKEQRLVRERGFLEESLLVAVGAKALRGVLGVGHRTNAIAQHAFRSQVRHVRRACAHRRQGWRVVIFLDRSFQRLKNLVAQR